MYIGLHLQNPSDCPILKKLDFSRHTSEILQTLNFMKLSPVGAELFNADRRTDRHVDANSCFSKF